MNRHLTIVVALALLAILPVGLVVVGSAAAEQPGGRAGAERLLAEIGRDSGVSAPVQKKPADQARAALERARGARSAGDVRHAEELEALAYEWAQVARDVARTAMAEADAGALEMALGDATVQAERARALLEESIARRGRALAELQKLDGGAAPANGSKAKGKVAPATKVRPADSAARAQTYGAQ